MMSWHAYKHSAPTVGSTPSTATRVLTGTLGWQFLYGGSVVPSSCMAFGVGGQAAERNVRVSKGPASVCWSRTAVRRRPAQSRGSWSRGTSSHRFGRGQGLSLRNGPHLIDGQPGMGVVGESGTGRKAVELATGSARMSSRWTSGCRARDGLPGHQPRDRCRRRPRRSEDRHPHHLRGNACVAQAPHAGACGPLGKRIDPTDPLEAIRQGPPSCGRRRSPALTDRRRGRPAIDPDRRT